MPTALASNDRVAGHLWRDRAMARSDARGRRAPRLGAPVLGPAVSGASLAGVLGAGVLRLAPRPPVVVTPFPRSHGNRFSSPSPIRRPPTRRAHASLELPPRRGPAEYDTSLVDVSKPTACLRPTPTRHVLPIRAKEVEK